MIKPAASDCYDLLPLESSLVTGQAAAEQRGGTTGRSERQFLDLDSAIVTSQILSTVQDLSRRSSRSYFCLILEGCYTIFAG